MKIMFTSTWKDGLLAPTFAALGFPPYWKQHEIRDISQELYDTLKIAGAPMTTDETELKKWEKIQPHYDMLNRQWREEKEAERIRMKERADAQRVMDEVARMLAQEEGAKMAKLTAKAREKLGIGA